MRRAIFLDKDGTLVVDVPYNVDPDKVTFAEGAREALRRLSAAGYTIVIVTNQSGVARGYFPESALVPLREFVAGTFRDWGVDYGGFYYCPHGEHDGCRCRKPRSGMIEDAVRELKLDSAGSWMIGDILNDVEAGNRAGCRTVLLDTGNETEWRTGPYRSPHVTVPDLGAAADAIVLPVREFAA